MILHIPNILKEWEHLAFGGGDELKKKAAAQHFGAVMAEWFYSAQQQPTGVVTEGLTSSGHSSRFYLGKEMEEAKRYTRPNPSQAMLRGRKTRILQGKTALQAIETSNAPSTCRILIRPVSDTWTND